MKAGDFAQPLARLFAFPRRLGKLGRVNAAADQRRLRRIDRPVIIEPTLGQSPLLAAAPVVAGDRLVGLAAIQLPPFGALATIAFDQAGHAFPRHPIAGG